MSMKSFEKHVSKHQCLKSRRSRIILTLFVLVVILAAVIPSVVITTLHRQNSMGPKSRVFVPLYIYPVVGAWTPLESVISDHPDVNFTVVVNPGNGPGPNRLPDANYTHAIPSLTSYANVRLLGDIETYANWPSISSNPNLAVRGIFVDETPQQYDAGSLAYLQILTHFAKGLHGFGVDPFVVHNPGTIPDPRYLPTADSTVVFEATYQDFQERKAARLFEAIPNSNRTQLCVLIHSVPESVDGPELRGFVKEARKVADEVFITHLSSDYYAGFGEKWAQFVDLMGT